jgi:hypothetical protein
MQIYFLNVRGREHLGDLGMDGRINQILKHVEKDIG